MAGLGPFEARPHLAVAVSGGPDSLALMHLLAEWCHGRDGRLTVLTVDHGLRPESADEAAQVAGWARDCGLEHVTLPWQGTKPQAGLQAAARAARYTLLSHWCRAAGVLHLATGHQADDQRETVAMRRARLGAGKDGQLGLAGMSAVTTLDGVRLLRPLLGQKRDAIIAYLQHLGQGWIDDPSNQADRFERIRWRKGQMGELPPMDEITAAGGRRQALELAAADLLMRAATVHEAGYVLVDPVLLAVADAGISEHAIGRLIGFAGGGTYRPAIDAVRRDLAAVLAGGGVRSLGGCLIGRLVGLWRGRLVICREAGAIRDRLWVEQPGEYRWDGRLILKVGRHVSLPLELAALGEAGLRELGAGGESRGFLGEIPPLARPGLPALRDATGRLIQVPFTGFDPFGLKDALICRLLPQNSVTSSGFTVAQTVPHTI